MPLSTDAASAADGTPADANVGPPIQAPPSQALGSSAATVKVETAPEVSSLDQVQSPVPQPPQTDEKLSAETVKPEMPPEMSSRDARTVRARALYDWHSDEKGDLTFRKGQIVEVTNRRVPGSGWFTGKLTDETGESGSFPWNHVRFVLLVCAISQDAKSSPQVQEICSDDETEDMIYKLDAEMESEETIFMKALGLSKLTAPRPRAPPRPQKVRPPATFATGIQVLANWKGNLTLANVRP